MYKNAPFRLLSKEEYINLVREAITLSPQDMVIHRVTAETNGYRLIAPKWVLDKQYIIHKLRRYISR